MLGVECLKNKLLGSLPFNSFFGPTPFYLHLILPSQVLVWLFNGAMILIFSQVPQFESFAIENKRSPFLKF